MIIFTAQVILSGTGRSQDEEGYMSGYTGAAAERTGSETCLMCHTDEIFLSDLTHAALIDNDPENPFYGYGCEGCHGPGGSHMGDPAGIINPSRLTRDQITDRCSLCHRSLGSYDIQYWPTTRHYEINLSCLSCHGGHSEFEYFLVNEDRLELCYTCHSQKRDESDQHSHYPNPDGEVGCSNCHNPHSGQFNQMLSAEPDDLCSSCHRERGSFDIHDWYTSEHYSRNMNCLDCHAGHSQFDFLLVSEDMLELCSSCHPEKRAGFNVHSRLEGETAGDGCFNCHNPHSGEYDWGLKDESEAVCLACHGSVEGLSLQAQEIRNWNLSGHYLSGVSCLDCHGGHSDFDYALLSEDRLELCFTCHSEKRAEFSMRSHHPVTEGQIGCYSCHNTHSGEYEWGLVDDGDELCFSCHPDKEGPFIYNHDMSLAGGDSGCVTCHLAHGSNSDSLLRLPHRLCIECHTDRGPDQHFPGSCWASGCHTEIHGSNSHPLFFY